MEFMKIAGFELLKNSYIKNLVIERLENDPDITNIDIGRIWFNTTDKKFKTSILNNENEKKIKSLILFEDLNDINGSSLIEYSGSSGTYGKFSISQTNLQNSLDLIVDKIDENSMSIDDINTGSLYNLQNELNNTRYSSGLSIIDGSYTANPSANYLTTATTLFHADQLLDAKIKANEQAISNIEGNIGGGVLDSINDLNDRLDNLQNELDFTQTIEGCGLEEDGSYTPNPSANYLSSVDNLYYADQLLDVQIKANEQAIYNINNNTTLHYITEDIDGNPLWKGDKWPIREDKTFKYISPLSFYHTINHNLGTIYIHVDVWSKDPFDGKFKTDVVNIVIEDNDTISVELSEQKELMFIIEAK